jgi:chemotaxis protein histidine kinase CheA
MENAMSDLYIERIAEVRQRFASRLDARIEDIACAMQHHSYDSGIDAIALAHRQAHGLCGVGATLGLVGTGKAARSIEQMLLAAVNAGRELTDDELPLLRDGIELLRNTAIAEIAAVH